MRLKGQVTEKGVLTRTRAAFLRYTHLPVCCTLCLEDSYEDNLVCWRFMDGYVCVPTPRLVAFDELFKCSCAVVIVVG